MPADPFWLFLGHRLHSQNHLRYWPSGKSVTCSYPLPGASLAGGPHLGDRVIYGILQFSSAVGAEFETI